MDALVTCHLEGVRVREGGVVRTKSRLEANDSQKDLLGGEPFEARQSVPH